MMNNLQMRSFVVWVAAIVSQCVAVAAAENSVMPRDKLMVHEWGTFTSLQDEAGRQLGGINVDDEPLPTFVHDLNPYVLVRSI